MDTCLQPTLYEITFCVTRDFESSSFVASRQLQNEGGWLQVVPIEVVAKLTIVFYRAAIGTSFCGEVERQLQTTNKNYQEWWSGWRKIRPGAVQP